MKFGFALLAGLLVADSVATGLQINASGCKVEKINKKDVFGCPCFGGSGDYDWHFSELPKGWYEENDKIQAKSGKFEDKKIYGAKVRVTDKKTHE